MDTPSSDPIYADPASASRQAWLLFWACVIVAVVCSLVA